MRVYEMTDNNTAREMTGYLLVRGGVHILAYAKALEIATGVDVTKLIPIPSLDNKAFETTRKWEAMGGGAACTRSVTRIISRLPRSGKAYTRTAANWKPLRVCRDTEGRSPNFPTCRRNSLQEYPRKTFYRLLNG